MTKDQSVSRALRPEISLLLECARTRVRCDGAEKIQGLAQSDLDWGYLALTASSHSVLPLLCHNLNKFCNTALPRAVGDELQGYYRANAQRNLSLAGDLLKTLQSLAENGIDALAFKGPVLAAAAYGSLALRQFGDLDILVREKDFYTAKALFLSQGFQPWRSLTPLEESRHYRREHAYTLVRSRDGLRLDLHWRMTQERYAFGLDIESLWGRLRRVPFCGREVLGLSPEDLLMILCLHGSKHCWERLGWICDIAEVLRANPDLNWEQIFATSAAIDSSRALLLGLELARNLLGAQLPAPVLEAIDADRRIRRVSHLIQRTLFDRTRKLGLLEKARIFFMTQEHLRNRLPHLAYSFNKAVTPNQADTNSLFLPSCLYFLYYPLRAIRLSRVGLGRMFNRTQDLS
jgi:hypothetical protein